MNRGGLSGYGYFSEVKYLTAARAGDGSFALVYFPINKTVSIDLGRLRSRAAATWFDPASDEFKVVEGSRFANGRTRGFTPPARNAAADEDFLLVLSRNSSRAAIERTATPFRRPSEKVCSPGPSP